MCCRTLKRDFALWNKSYYCLFFFVTCTFRTLCCYGIIRETMCCKTIERGFALQDPFLGTVHITASTTCIFRTLSFHGIIRVTMCCKTFERVSALRNPFLSTNYITVSFYNVYIPYNVCFYSEYFTNSKIPKPNNVNNRRGNKKVRIKHEYCSTVYWFLVSIMWVG